MDIARSSIKIFTTEILVVLMSVLSLIYFARELGSANLGVFFLFQALLFFFSKPADLGLRFATEKRISEDSRPASFLTTGLLMKTILLLIVLLGLYLGRGHVTSYLGADLIGLLAIALVLQEMGGLMKNAISGELRVGKTAYLDFSYNLAKYGGGALLVYLGFGVLGLIVSLVAGLLIRFAFAFRERNTEFGTPGWEEMHSLIEYAKFTIIPSVGTQVYQWMDILIIGLFLSHASVGAYEVAWRIAAPVLLLSQSISTVIFPQISSWESAGSKGAIERLFSRVMTPSLIFVFPSIFGTVVLSKEILTLVFGSEYQVAWLALIVIMSGKISGSLRKLTGRLLYGLNKPKFVTIASVVELTSNVVLNVVLVLQFGIVGAAIGTAVSVTIGTLIRSYYLSRLIDIRVPYDELGWCLVASIAMAALLYGGKAMVGINTIIQLGVFVVSGAILYGIFVLLYSPLRTQIKTQIEDHVSFAS